MPDEEKIETPVETPKQETPAVDYKKQYEEVSAKYKDVDLERYERAKDFDFEKAQAALKFQEKLEADRLAKEQEEANRDPLNKLSSEVGRIKQTLAQKEAAEKRSQQDSWMRQYHQGVDTAIDTALKGEFKDLEELSPAEKKLIKLSVNQAYEADAMQKVHKLGHEQIGGLVAQAIKEVKENRTFITSKSVKRQTSPSMPTAQDGAAPKQFTTTGQKIEAMADFMRAAR